MKPESSALAASPCHTTGELPAVIALHPFRGCAVKGYACTLPCYCSVSMDKTKGCGTTQAPYMACHPRQP